MLGFDETKEVNLEALPWYTDQHGDGQDDTESEETDEDDDGAGRRVRRHLNEE
jgi:hypothetical protein